MKKRLFPLFVLTMEYDWDAMVLTREDSSSSLLSLLMKEATLSIEPSSSFSRTRFEMIVLLPAHSDSSTCVWREEEETNRIMSINTPFIIPLLITLLLLLLLLLMLSIPAVHKIYHFIVTRLPAIQRAISRKPYLLPLNTSDTINEEVLIAKLEYLADDFQCETHSLSLDDAKEALRRFTLYSESLLTALDRSVPSMITSSDQLKSILQSIESLNRQLHLFAKKCERFGFSIQDTSDRLLYLHLFEEATQLANRFESSLQLLYNQQSTCQQRALICDLQTSLDTNDVSLLCI